ncbi:MULTISPECIES: HWE histidine kinase domain-containing protein [unclassified Rhizobium]|uniref:sensor histidine kinase n=1 Tax=unclassified Rhizobium TaxID=2613769 RepID=UPI0006FB182F|nr:MULTISPECIES: HWE histidine kinase domain-containing protein [unclassified Rhizobium]KQV38165.1 histidine kinase [Rhizobium sp. Root1212]KRD30822.1 histidine kinase [Rhizobium sp. Root268]
MTDELTVLKAAEHRGLASPSRIEALRSFVPDMATRDPDFDALTILAAKLFKAPIALVTLLDEQHQWFKAAFGTHETAAPAATSFCAHAIEQPEGGTLVVKDAAVDPRFAGQPFVVGAPFLRFYAGAPVFIGGEAVGTVCVFDVEPRSEVGADAVEQLAHLAHLASSLMRLKQETRERALKEAEISREEKRHEMALDAANIGSWLWNIRSGGISCNLAMTRMFGFEPSTTLQARDIFAAIHPDDRLAALARLRSAMANDEEYDGVFRLAKGGRWVLGRGRVHERDAFGRPTVFLGINIDVTQEQASNQRTRLLLRELNHRVKNTLAMLQSLARQTLRTTSDPELFMTAFAGRLQAISEAHGLLSDHEWGAIRLSALINKQLAPHVRDYDKQVEIHKDEILLGPDQAVGLGLVLHELATNAAKYGSLSRSTGKVIITARRLHEDGMTVLRMTWVEVGGPPVSEPERKGFGSILIERSLDKVMGSSVEVQYLPAGLTALVRLPL